MKREEVPPDAEKLFAALLVLAEVKEACLGVHKRLEKTETTGVIAVDSMVSQFNRGVWGVYEITENLITQCAELIDVNHACRRLLGLLEVKRDG
ncbi:MAG: hypothetical protein KGJ89_05520 [Patescibacteria group bacterium]|nr:hypothetical protein [Patescibacteria group bacterium]MDE2227381.1 hypothetical protein [Patescibacteria group bacterium]